MPHTNRKKKPSSNNPSTKKSTLTQHTKRKEIQADDGWVHIIDTPRSRRSPAVSKEGNLLQVGDFEIAGHAYVKRSIGEMGEEVGFWKGGWKGGRAEGELGRLVRGEEAIVVEKMDGNEVEGEGEGELDVEENLEQENAELQLEEEKKETTTQELEQSTPNIVEEKQEDTSSQDTPPQPIPESQPEQSTQPQTEQSQTPTPPPRKPRRTVDNIIVLGLGSLQSARREGRRASATQLAALETIVENLISLQPTPSPLPMTIQEPLFTPLDKAYLTSLSASSKMISSIEIVEDPVAFERITEGSLVYAIHCYGDVYRAVASAKCKPACFVGTEVGLFEGPTIKNGPEAGTETETQTTSDLLNLLVKDCEILAFPQLRHDFSDTKIYWRSVKGIVESEEKVEGKGEVEKNSDGGV